MVKMTECACVLKQIFIDREIWIKKQRKYNKICHYFSRFFKFIVCFIIFVALIHFRANVMNFIECHF